MPSINELWTDEAETSFTYNGVTVTFKYRPSEYTMGLIEEMESPDSGFLEIRTILAERLLVSWDITETKGPKAKPIPITADGLKRFGPNIAGKFLEAIRKDVNDMGEAESSSVAG